MDKQVYTKLDLRRLLDITERTLERWVKRGKFPPPIFPGSGRWDRATVDAWRQQSAKQWADNNRHFATSSKAQPEINGLTSDHR